VTYARTRSSTSEKEAATLDVLVKVQKRFKKNLDPAEFKSMTVNITASFLEFAQSSKGLEATSVRDEFDPLMNEMLEASVHNDEGGYPKPN